MRLHRTLLTASAAAVIALGACGDDAPSPAPVGGGTSDASQSDLTVLAEDIGFPQDTYRAPAGTVDVTYENDGSIAHTLLVEGVDDFELRVDAEGDVDEGTVDLEPGTYTIYCDIAGHRAAGMEATLEVE